MELLKQLYTINAPSGNEMKMKEFILGRVRKIGGIQISGDKYGNLYFKKGIQENYPALVCHLDETHEPNDIQINEYDGKIFGYSKENGEPAGIGADDKNGIWIILKALEKFNALKAAMFVEEEIGCRGARNCDLSFFADCRYVIEPDRKGKNDLITTICGKQITDPQFIKDCGFERFGYQETEGKSTDVAVLTEKGVGISTINLSCGYYNPHTPNEYTVIDDLRRCRMFIESMIEKLTDVYRFPTGIMCDR